MLQLSGAMCVRSRRRLSLKRRLSRRIKYLLAVHASERSDVITGHMSHKLAFMLHFLTICGNNRRRHSVQRYLYEIAENE